MDENPMWHLYRTNICEKFWRIKCPVAQPTPLEVPREIAFSLFYWFLFETQERQFTFPV